MNSLPRPPWMTSLVLSVLLTNPLAAGSEVETPAAVPPERETQPAARRESDPSTEQPRAKMKSDSNTAKAAAPTTPSRTATRVPCARATTAPPATGRREQSLSPETFAHSPARTLPSLAHLTCPPKP